MTDADPTAKKQRVDVLRDNAFKPGQSGNPTGRPRGSRNKLGEAFIEALHDDFNEHGVAAIQTMRAEDPSGYVRVIAGILPKEVKIETNADLTDEQLDNRIRQLAAVLEIGIGGPVGGEAKAQGPQQTSGVPTVQ
jgi:hypothetical protein